MSERTALYRLYDDKDGLVYVGVTQDPERRFRQHQATKAWWLEVVTREVEWFDDSESALAEERRLIRKELPRYNERGRAWLPELGDQPAESTGIAGFHHCARSYVQAVVETEEPLIITKHGKPIAVLCPYPRVDQIAKGK